MPELHAVKPHLVLSPNGAFRVDRTTNYQLVNALLNYVRGKKPMTLTYGTDRTALMRLMEQHSKGRVFVSLECKREIHKALQSSKQDVPVILPPTDYERFGHIKDHSNLTALETMDVREHPKIRALLNKKPAQKLPILIAGENYTARYQSVEFRSRYKKPRLKLENGETVVVNNEYELRGNDHSIIIRDEQGHVFRFRDNALGDRELPCELIWLFFQEVEVKTVKDANPEEYAKTLQMIDELGFLNGFKCYPGQIDYITSLGMTDYALVAAETGTGKSFIAIVLDLLKNNKRTLLIAPKGTIKDGELNGASLASQWMKEFKQFSPTRKVFKLFSEKDYQKIIQEHGELPAGVYFTYHTVFFRGFEHIPASWQVNEHNARFKKWLRKTYSIECEQGVAYGIGETRNGITCIAQPNLSTKVGKAFDMVILDEAHLICNPKSGVTRSMLRLQPKYKFCLTATPIPNAVRNLFPLMGWLAVPNWYQGDVSNSRWPYTLNDENRFVNEFQSKEYDITARLNGEYKAPKNSPILSNKQKLLRMVKTIIAFITKEQCNPDLVDCNVETIRVPFGKYQKQLYSWNMDLGNIPHEDHRTKHGVQMMRLRGICSDPEGREFNKFPGFKMVESNMNPKVIAILSKIAKCIQEGEQVVHVSAFTGLNDELEKRLQEAGVKVARIDGTPGLDQAAQAAIFKEKKAQVMLMGIKCAAGHSFDQCKELIIGGLEWSYGSLNQALGRVFRLNSPKDVNAYIVLTESSIEEMMFDRLAQKRDSATIILHGEPIPHDYQDTSVQEIFADHFLSYSRGDDNTMNEVECEQDWVALQMELQPRKEEFDPILID